MKIMKTLVALAALLPVVASAQSIDHRQSEQHKRIVQGVRDGSLTRHEAARLREREARIRAQERRDRRDGHGLSRSERLRLQRELDRTSHSVHGQRHDGQHRPH